MTSSIADLKFDDKNSMSRSPMEFRANYGKYVAELVDGKLRVMKDGCYIASFNKEATDAIKGVFFGEMMNGVDNFMRRQDGAM